jgi:hypothetical protein
MDMQLREVVPVRRTVLVAIGASAVLAGVIVTRQAAPEPEPRVVVVSVVETTLPPVAYSDPCPAFARTSLHVDAETPVRCAQGSFGEPGWFAIARYTTTEPWERFVVLSADGSRVLVPMLDQPVLGGGHNDLFDAAYRVVPDAGGLFQIDLRYANGAREALHFHDRWLLRTAGEE